MSTKPASAAVSIPNPLPAMIVALSDEILARAEALAEQAHAIAITDAVRYEEANTVYRDMNALAKAVEADRKRIKAPVIALGKEIDEAASLALEPLEAQRRDLGEKIARYQQAENAKREQLRREAEAAAKAEEERQRKAAEEEALMLLPPGEEAPVFVAPVQVAVPVVATPPPLKSAVVTRTVTKVEILDASLLPARAGALSLVKEWDLKAIEAALKVGLLPAGAARLVEVVETRAGRA